MLTVVTKANLSPIFGLYPDPECEAQNLLDAAVAGKTPLVATDHLGVVHRLWPVTDVAVIAKLSAVMGPKPIFIADGHHRYETACNYRDQVYDSGFLSPEHPANYMLMMCVAMDDPGLVIMPTHRLFRGLPAMTADQLAARLGDCFAGSRQSTLPPRPPIVRRSWPARRGTADASAAPPGPGPPWPRSSSAHVVGRMVRAEGAGIVDLLPVLAGGLVAVVPVGDEHRLRADLGRPPPRSRPRR